MRSRKIRIAKWALAGLGLVLIALFGVLSYLLGGPKRAYYVVRYTANRPDQAYGLLRYGLPQTRQGELQVGARAPDVELVSLDGESRFRLHEKIGSKPLVLIFGSYT
ncbi:MAG: hypothetical protein ACE5H2_03145 [Terriglobia bacterium]